MDFNQREFEKMEIGEIENQVEKIEADIPSNFREEKQKSIPFSVIVKFYEKISILRGPKKGHQSREFFKAIYKISRNPLFIYSILRVIMPSDDRTRGNYGLKEKGLAKIISDTLNLKKQDYERLYHYKNPSYHSRGLAIGDFSMCVYETVQKVCKEKPSMSVLELNVYLDKLAAPNVVFSEVFQTLLQKATALEMKWIIRIILKDLKLNLKTESILKILHEDANDFFNLTNNLLDVCKKFQNPNVSMHDEISIFNPIKPMLAGKKNITFFKFQEKDLFVETKYDGERIQAHWDGNQVRLFSRNAVNYTFVYKEVVEILQKNIQADACILDGEIIVLENGSNQMVPFGMNKVVALSANDKQMHLCYKIFDVVWIKLDGEQINLMKFSLEERKKILENTVKPIEGFLETVKHKVVRTYDQIVEMFSASIDRNEEGIMIKDPFSMYAPKQRGTSWLKLKGDYIDGLTDTLDLLIIGGYLGDKSYRQGTSGHWIDKITTFLLGVIEAKQQGFEVIPFCKVGTGYTASELNELRHKLKSNLVLFDSKSYPKGVRNWKYNIQDKPDCWVRQISSSVILEIKAAEIIDSDSYLTTCTLRFPRVVKIRFDKDPNEAMSLNELKQMRNTDKYSKNMKKINSSQSDEQNEKRKDGKDPKAKKKVKTENQREKRLNHRILEDFVGYELSSEDRKKSNTFYGLNFVVLSIDSSKYTKQDIERQILLNGGNVTQNPLSKTNYMVSDCIDFRLNLYEKHNIKKIKFVKSKYIIHCCQEEKLVPLRPFYLTCLPREDRNYFIENYDRFSDSYVDYLNQKQLEVILNEIPDDNQMINQELISVISNKPKRYGNVCLCIGISRLEKNKLKIHGSKILDELTEETIYRLDSIVVGKPLKDYEQNVINKYREMNPRVVIEKRQELREIGIL